MTSRAAFSSFRNRGRQPPRLLSLFVGVVWSSLEPVLRTVKDKLVAAAPEHFTVEFGVKLGGETGIILAKGTAEVNMKITMTWDQET